MRLVAVAFALVVAGSSATAAQADPLTAGQLMVRCAKLDVADNQVKLRSASVGDALDAGKCWGHLEAYLDLASIKLPGANNANMHPLGACPPYGLNFTQVAELFLQHIRSTPADFRKPAVSVIATLLAEKYPCPK
jgi:hypothetical protein